MKYILIVLFFLSIISSGQNNSNQRYRNLTEKEKAVILFKGTEAAFTGKYYQFDKEGVYTCKRCGAELYRSEDKFSSHCGWPSFDDEIKGAIKKNPDRDGKRTEIVCSNCGAHLGHLFRGEQFTSKNTRHCVNSISLNFTEKSINDTVYLAGGCFWGVEYYMQQQKGVVSTQVGYIGGRIDNPTYRIVCSKTTDYAEAVQVIYDTKKTNFENLAKVFFEIHDPTQLNRQGPDIGAQYRSAIFYTKIEQKDISRILIRELKQKGFQVKTVVEPATKFYSAEDYHQNYYLHKGTKPYCHIYTKRF